MTLTEFRTKLNNQLRDSMIIMIVSLIGLLSAVFLGTYFSIPMDSKDAILLEVLVLFCGGYVTGNYFYNKLYITKWRWVGYVWGTALAWSYIINCIHLGTAISTLF